MIIQILINTPPLLASMSKQEHGLVGLGHDHALFCQPINLSAVRIIFPSQHFRFECVMVLSVCYKKPIPLCHRQHFYFTFEINAITFLVFQEERKRTNSLFTTRNFIHSGNELIMDNLGFHHNSPTVSCEELI